MESATQDTAAGAVAPSGQEAAQDAPTHDNGRVKRPPRVSPPAGSAPGQNKLAAVIDAIRAGGEEPVVNAGRDGKALRECSESPQDIATAFLCRERWGSDWLRAHPSIHAICADMATYQAWKRGVRTNGARASPVGKAGVQARSRELLHAIATGGGDT